MNYFIPVMVLLAVVLAWGLVYLIILCHCVEKRMQGRRAHRWLEILAGYSKEQRNQPAASTLVGKHTGNKIPTNL
jgi:hypothetical protein